VILSLGACRLYGEPTRICKACGLRREWNGSRSGESQAEASVHYEVGVKRTVTGELMGFGAVLQQSELSRACPPAVWSEECLRAEFHCSSS
jgi:hypothetical protein